MSLLHLCVLAIKNSLRRTTKKASQNSRAMLHKQHGTTRPLCSRYKELFFGAQNNQKASQLFGVKLHTQAAWNCVCVCRAMLGPGSGIEHSEKL